jgi:hypothetical protein
VSIMLLKDMLTAVVSYVSMESEDISNSNLLMMNNSVGSCSSRFNFFSVE